MDFEFLNKICVFKSSRLSVTIRAIGLVASIRDLAAALVVSYRLCQEPPAHYRRFVIIDRDAEAGQPEGASG